LSKDFFSQVKTILNQYIDKYKDNNVLNESKEWLKNNTYKVKTLFENYSLRDFVLEPFKSVFSSSTKTLNADIYSVITQVAVINAVLAGLPGKMGVGVAVSMALEAWMAYQIANHVGLKINNVSDIRKYIGVLIATIASILWIVKAALGIAFSLFSVVSGPLNPLIFAELLVTDLLGIGFWLGFSNVRNNKSFESFGTQELTNITKELFLHQYNILKNILTPENIKTTGKRIVAYLKGDFPVDQRLINGEVFSTVAMAYLISGQYEKLDGPLGDIFIDAIRLRWSSQFNEDTSIEEIGSRFQEYSPDQIEGAINTIKGKMFEIMATEQENLDGDQWHATMHTDESFPGSDIIFSDIETGEQIEVSLKAISLGNSQIIDEALKKYPDMPIMTTEEVATLYKDDPRVFGSGVFNEDLENISEEKFNELVNNIEPIDHYQVIIGGVTIGSAAALWPYVIHYLRKKISYEQLETVFNHLLGEAGLKLVSRISYGFVFGPLFAWWLLARGIKGLVTMAEPTNKILIELKTLAE
jgi:hypothetical protein